ncbi:MULTISPECIES: TetR/AcrR family transcriptional regulator [Streptococcus]|uniref:TetR/AcrR family transcriptional regulator n=1 Tax=Streptococcus gordonii TaxID=1302 RepID=A0AB35FSB0_STRGN|nr:MULTISPECIES: TetR/AcrR family transcriptional regulator [Streptococcus]MBZ2126895.1 TetR/AcrR family transcriptional regulator [Streptococcus gordonii]MBZ2128909.1 TetR/AcrR family transcriptional regulator [Streptococcus gordonii]MBZ2139072.1 TetR/AcrR family transcriptional regulator [Streptococcus gordonii]OFL20148.1 TetR family transcriptional regulator [Streptococcus sp. HMSC062B01]RSJ62414.1 HTH-type transcriptional repressor KstR2 [Streptococcus gordonii]
MANKKEFILDVAEKMFIEQGFDQTSIAQILDATQIAKGTLYYYFTSKEEIMDAIIERWIERSFEQVRIWVEQKQLPILERLMGALASLNMQKDGQELLDHLHAPQNALLHEKTNQILLSKVPEILYPLFQEGFQTGEMQTTYPYETIEMMLTYSLQIFNSSFQTLDQAEKNHKIQAFIYLLEKIFQTKEGYFSSLAQLIH